MPCPNNIKKLHNGHYTKFSVLLSYFLECFTVLVIVQFLSLSVLSKQTSDFVRHHNTGGGERMSASSMVASGLSNMYCLRILHFTLFIKVAGYSSHHSHFKNMLSS